MQWGTGVPSDNNNDNDSVDGLSDDEEQWAEEEEAVHRNPADFVECLSEDVSHLKKPTKIVFADTVLRIKKLPANPVGMLRAVIAECIEKAIQESRKQGFEPNRLGCVIENKGLHYDIGVALRPIQPDLPDYILAEFLKIEQSKRWKGINLYENPFKVRVQTQYYPAIRQQQQQQPPALNGGARRPEERRQMAPIRHNIAPNQIINVFIYFIK